MSSAAESAIKSTKKLKKQLDELEKGLINQQKYELIQTFKKSDPATYEAMKRRYNIHSPPKKSIVKSAKKAIASLFKSVKGGSRRTRRRRK